MDPAIDVCVHKYALSLLQKTQIHPCDKAMNLPNISFNFKSIADVKGMDVNETVDVLAIFTGYTAVENVKLKTKVDGGKRDFCLMDASDKVCILLIS